MKKIISMLLCLVTVFSAAAVLGMNTRSSAAVAYVPGDVNMDGAVTIKDVLALRKQISGESAILDYDATDINGDSNVLKLNDLLLLRRVVVSMDTLEDPHDSTVGRIRIGNYNIKHFSIVVTNGDNPNMVFAAEELRKYVKQAAGYELPIKSENVGTYRIVLREDEGGSLGDEGFAITVDGTVLTVMGGAKRGIMYGVYEILEEYLGYRFYGWGHTQLYEKVNADIPDGTVNRQVPDTSYRSMGTQPFGNDYVESTTVKRKVNGSSGTPALNNEKYGYGIERLWANAHSFNVFIPSMPDMPCLTDLPPEEEMELYYSDEFWNNLEFYSAEPIYAFEECVANMVLILQQRLSWGYSIGKEITEISCSYNWTNMYCPCSTCKALYNEEGSYSAHLCDFVNLVSEVIHSRYPDLQFITNAYATVRIPPKTKSLNDDIILLYCWNGCASHPIGTDECEGCGKTGLNGCNAIEEANYLGWLEHCNKTYVWYYPTNIYYMLSPLPNVFTLYQNFKWLIEHDCIGFYVQGTAGDAFEGLISYLMSEMMWDKDITYEQYCDMVKEYMLYYYGEGWENIYRYAEMMEESAHLQGCFMNDYDYPLTMYNAQYQIDHFDEQMALFDAALEAAGSDWQKENIIRLSAHVKFLYYAAAYESVYVNGNAEQREEYEEGYRAWYDLVNEYNIRITYEKTGLKNDLNLNQSPLKFVYGLNA